MPESSFPEFESETPADSEPGGVFPDPEASEMMDFHYDDTLIRGIAADPGVRAEVERVIESRIRENLKGELEKAVQQAQERGYAQGYQDGAQKGFQEGAEQWREIRRQIETFCTQLHAQKNKLLTDHEQEWIAALEHVFKECLIPIPEQTIQHLRKWIDQRIDAFGQGGKVRLRISTQDYDRISAKLALEPAERWEFIRDPNLSAGELAAEFDSHGYIFSPQPYLNEVLSILRPEQAVS